MKVVIEIPDGIDPPKADYVKPIDEELKAAYEQGYKDGQTDYLAKLKRLLRINDETVRDK